MNVAAAKRLSKMDSGGGSPDSIASVSPQQLLVSSTSAQQQQHPQPPRGGRIRTASSANSLITTSSGGLCGSTLGFDRNGSNGTLPTITFPSSGVLSPSQSMNGYPLWEELDEDILGSDILGFTASNSSAAPDIGLQHHHPFQQVWPSSPGMSSISPLAPPPTINSLGTAPIRTNNTANSSQHHWPTFENAPPEELTTRTTTTATQQQPIISEEEIHEFIAMYTNCSTVNANAPPSTPAVQFYPSSTTTRDFSSTTNTDNRQRKPILCTYHNFPEKPSTDSNEQRLEAAANTTQSSTASAIYTNNNNHHQRQASSSFLQQMQSLLNPDLVHPESNSNVSMLPPPPRLPGSNETPAPENNVQVASLAQQKQSKSVDLQHLVWIRELNQRAKQIWEQHNGSNTNSTTTAQPPKASTTTYSAPSYPATFPAPVHPFYRTQPTVPPASATTTGAGTASSSSQGSATSTNEVVYDWHNSQQQQQQEPQQQQQPKQQQSVATAATTPGSESDERRARRLMRNRESARQSRRRKKETLSFLGKKVQKLHDALEEKRASQILEMEQQLLQIKNNSSSATIAEIVDMYKEHAKLRKQVSLFQYNTMKDTLLPQYHQFLLWISNQCKENFYTAAKESRPKSSSKMSSKQIGEEIATTERQEPNHSGKYLECNTEDVQRFWPLFCYEFSFSVEQEEKFKNRYMEHRAKVQEDSQDDDESSVHRLASAFALVSKLAEKGTLHNNYNAVALRRERVLLKVLTEQQSDLFLKWMEENRERCAGLYQEKSQNKQEQQQLLSLAALDQLCDQLEKTLNIHYINNDQDEMSD